MLANKEEVGCIYPTPKNTGKIQHKLHIQDIFVGINDNLD